jgi:hypothetical protein
MKAYQGAAVLAAAALLAGVPAQAGNGSNSSSITIGIHAFVPVICHVELNGSPGMPGSDGIVPLGMADEFCNAPQGYRVLIQHPAGLVDAAVYRNGVRIPLSPAGETVLTDSSQPALQQLALALDPGDHPEQFTSLGVRIESKG